MPQRSDARSRMIQAASELFAQRGYHACAFSDVIQESGAPRGSIYFHFPGGKQQLARETIALAGDEIEVTVAQAAGTADGPGSLVRALAAGMAERLEESDYKHGCSIATMVLELAPHDEELTTEFDTVFARWRAALVASFEAWGIPPERGGALADVVMSTFEGALILSRAARSSEPFWSSVEALADMVDAAEVPSSRHVSRGAGARRGGRRGRGVRHE